MNRSIFIFLAAAVFCLSGCSHKAKWLNGKWVFDADYTEQKLAESQQKPVKDKGLVAGLKDFAKGLVAPRLLDELKGSEITVTDKEFIMTGKEGNGKSYTYELIDAPDADTITLKLSDGDVDSFHRDGDRFWMTATGDVNLRVYYLHAK